MVTLGSPPAILCAVFATVTLSVLIFSCAGEANLEQSAGKSHSAWLPIPDLKCNLLVLSKWRFRSHKSSLNAVSPGGVLSFRRWYLPGGVFIVRTNSSPLPGVDWGVCAVARKLKTAAILSPISATAVNVPDRGVFISAGLMEKIAIDKYKLVSQSKAQANIQTRVSLSQTVPAISDRQKRNAGERFSVAHAAYKLLNRCYLHAALLLILLIIRPNNKTSLVIRRAGLID